jgi:4-amino-4-deoxy-L-arabinose transferase-like glycosyltransferase
MNSLTRSNTGLYTLFSACVLVGFFLNIHAVPLFDLDEGAFSEATREMFVRGDFISPYLNGAPRYDKPVLIHWLQAASVWTLGLNEFALRLPSALAAALWSWLIFLFTKRYTTTATALYAAIITASTLQISLIAKAAIADALLNLFLSSAMFNIYLFYQSREQRYVYLSAAAMALGFLTKGPVAVVIPLAVSLLFFLSKGKFNIWLKALFNLRAIALFGLLALPWYVAQYLREGEDFIQGFFFKHNIARFGETFEQHGGGGFYYIPVVLIGLLPYTALLLKTFIHLGEIVKDDLKRYLLMWFLFVLIFFSFSGTKLPHYAVYGYPAAIILMAMYMDTLRSRFMIFLPPLLLFTALLFLPELIHAWLPAVQDVFIKDTLRDAGDYFSLYYRFFFSLAILLTVYFMFENRFRYPGKLLCSGLVTVTGMALFVLPIAGQILQSPVKEAALIAKRADYAVVMWGLNAPSFNVYSERLVERREPRPGEIALTKSSYLPRLKGYEMLYYKNGIALIRVKP